MEMPQGKPGLFSIAGIFDTFLAMSIVYETQRPPAIIIAIRIKGLMMCRFNQMWKLQFARLMRVFPDMLDQPLQIFHDFVRLLEHFPIDSLQYKP